MVFYTFFYTTFSSWWGGWDTGRETRCETGQSQGTPSTIFFPAFRGTGARGRPRWGPFSRGNFPLCTRRRRDGFGGLLAGLSRRFLVSPLRALGRRGRKGCVRGQRTFGVKIECLARTRLRRTPGSFDGIFEVVAKIEQLGRAWGREFDDCLIRSSASPLRPW
jgi:hypothetical protein